MNVVVEPGYSRVETFLTDQTGRKTYEATDDFTTSYRLSIDRAFTRYLSAGAGGTLLDARQWQDTNGVASESHGRSTSLFGRISLGSPVLNTQLGADRREQRVVGTTSGFVTESFTGSITWRPADLPELDLRAGHTNSYDVTRRAQDVTSDNASLSARYSFSGNSLRYLVGWTRANDHLNGLTSTAIGQSALVTRADTLFRGRTSLYVSSSLRHDTVSTVTRGDTGTVSRQQLPVAGISAVESPPASAERVTLSLNPLLIDGSTTAAAGANVGFGPSALGDRDARAVGARFADSTTAVNTIYVWFDRPLTPEVGTALATSVQVYQSNDNDRWTAVPVALPPTVAVFDNRIEITTVQTQARFYKVTLRPLALGVTTDPVQRDVFVTEVQFFLVLPAALLPRVQRSLLGSANASARTVILRSPNIAHDVALSVSRRSDADVTPYSIVNGLSAGYKVTASTSATARAARQDEDPGTGHEGAWQWSAGLAGNPLPTAYWSVTYSGSAEDSREIRTPFGTEIDPGAVAHSATALARADWYEGISSQASTGVTTSTEGATTTRAVHSSVSTSLTPNPLVTLSASALYNRSVASSEEFGDVLQQFARVDGSLSLTPAPALSATATVSRVLLGATPTTLASVQLSYFPLRGDLQLSLAYSKSLDTEAETTTELFSPSLRWNVRRGIAFTASYRFLQTIAPVQELTSRGASANLIVAL